jgi:hypothetical protein
MDFQAWKQNPGVPRTTVCRQPAQEQGQGKRKVRIDKGLAISFEHLGPAIPEAR